MWLVYTKRYYIMDEDSEFKTIGLFTDENVAKKMAARYNGDVVFVISYGDREIPEPDDYEY